ncbi:NADH dehydrogenase subunit 2 (mitochondrion) [Symphalangus syndactylus]|uniref:NADH-ubiquinone oxidoreductase chain 2 n=2 Tax=Symphalangus syndactylus TaxID=9590 RepID=NU2M_SYMSY|nr:NADH dehydrogenase subunit 2 [Symphalangus syndactylus]Q34799.1 RecName: Full=NADH-ubiquinone oxidoreductase chain 2; AltName: Full=NADH dehydrogenase subunit 2 [Symphalangus syndactylus]ADT82388.1 NADH dehydrogenase subunit 2 [Symphalangus syndactylus]ADT82401.1 NADH dehydrogenase subunit 2 [Symphalangus syndactylus]ADT82414.1 NADH dehydrogenase subunit 2 [Symphalangus syndactylus]ADT82427.1 NADH dehydrogenase subunit 2 [Symphalangus syndactylus]ADT82453.1 NADH dehydrogenase subunit 2 [Sy
MNPLAQPIIYSTIFAGTLITASSSHWFLAWVGLEMNMLAFIPVLTKKMNPRSTEAAIKYFLVQATASMILMMAILSNNLLSGQWTTTNITNQYSSLMILTALAMKLGMAPFHFWVPEVTQGTTLTSGLLLLTWQKLAPISIMYQIFPVMNVNILLTFSILSIMVGSWGGLNQTQLRKILAYSSITHVGWMTAVLPYNPNITIFNLTIYIVLTTTAFLALNLNSSTTTLLLSRSWNKLTWLLPLIPSTLLSLGGLPPLTGFLPKWLVIEELTKNGTLIIPTIMAIVTLINLYFYMRLIYSTSITLFPTSNNVKMKWQFENMKPTLLLPTLTILTTLLLPIAPLTFPAP